MNSPFPGMNPYLEHPEFWHDFHQRLVIHLSEEIGKHLSDNYFAKLDERIYIQEAPEEPRTFLGQPDVGVFSNHDSAPPPSNGAMVVDPPPLQLEMIPPLLEEERDAFIEIRDRQSRRLITVIELLSPSNKAPVRDREQYEYKRNQLLSGAVNLVEIDLLRRWPRLPVKNLPPCDYCLYVSQPDKWPLIYVWPFQITEPFPPLVVPLQASEQPLKIDLGAVFQRVFAAANYAKIIYSEQLDPPLNEELARWANELVSVSKNR